MTDPAPGLRERKRLRLRRELRDAAVRLIEEQGYAATTVEQIADACDVSPSTFFRQFRNKDEAVAYDIVDAGLFEALLAQPEGDLFERAAGAVTAAFDAMTDEEWEVERRRMDVLVRTPELGPKLLEEALRPFRLALEAVGALYDVAPDSVEARVLSGAVMGAMTALVWPAEGGGYRLPGSRDEAKRVICAALQAAAGVVSPPRERS